MADTEEQRVKSLAGKARTMLSDAGQDELLKQAAAVAKDVAEPADGDRPSAPAAPRLAPRCPPQEGLEPPGGPAVRRPAAGTRRLVRDALRRDPEDRWAAVFGRIAGYSFAVAVVTGVLLLPSFRPSMPAWCITARTGCWMASR